MRYFILASHYRSPLNYSDQNLDSAKSALERFYTALRGIEAAEVEDGGEYESRFRTAMSDDFNTAEALAVLFEMANALNKAKNDNAEQAALLAGQLRYLGGVLGLLQDDADVFMKGGATAGGLSDAEVDDLIQQRATAKSEKNWAEADRIRDELQAQGIILEDGPGGTTWRR
jgi:cysteinyl-tRNA synthetase